MPTLLITSVGSLVGQNLLDCLEGRRQSLRVLGSNSLAASPNNFRCDSVYLAPAVADAAGWRDFHARLIETEAVDLVIPGRDDDVLALAQLREERPELAPKLMVGSLVAARALHDKGQCAVFAQSQGLPFAATVLAGAPASAAQAEALWRLHGTLIAKPRAGNGSRGVRLVSTREQVWRAAAEPGLVLQPYFDPQPEARALAEAWALGVPLWSEVPERALLGAQFLIDPQGQAADPFCYVARQSAGKPGHVAHCQDTELAVIARRYAQVLADAGWRGAGNLQAKRDAQAGLQVIEVNGRFTGTTHARRLLGFDELGLALRQWLNGSAIAMEASRALLPAPGDQVCQEQWLAGVDIQQLDSRGVWHRA